MMMAHLPGNVRGLLGVLLLLALGGQIEARPKTVHREIDAKTAFETFEYHRKDGFRHFGVLDVRPAEKRKEAIPGAVPLPADAAARRGALEKLALRGKAYLVYCGDGKRSAAVMGEMKDLHFVEVYSLKGGFPTWKQKGYPVEKPARSR